MPIAFLALPTPASGQQGADHDSIGAWTRRLRAGTFAEKSSAVERLRSAGGGALPSVTQDAIVAELTRVNAATARLPGSEEYDTEAAAEYGMDLAILAYEIHSRAATRALVPWIGMSTGFARRVATLGDEVIPLLADMAVEGPERTFALETMGYAWFWSDSTGAPLSDGSRTLILRSIMAAAADGTLRARLGAVRSVAATKDPAFHALALAWAATRGFTASARLRQALQDGAIPTLERAEAAATPAQLAGRFERALAIACSIGPRTRRTFCQPVQSTALAATREVGHGRYSDARQSFLRIAARADEALRIGVLSRNEHALIAGTARRLAERSVP
jgi:hypothetical protein